LARTEIRIAGFGGQGVITAGYILANSASIHDDKHAVMTQSYGPEARGGACRSDAIISDAQIDYPKTTRPDVLVAMSLDAFNMYNREVRDGGMVIYDEDLVTRVKDRIRAGQHACLKHRHAGSPPQVDRHIEQGRFRELDKGQVHEIHRNQPKGPGEGDRAR